ncbi:MAG: hypothetical protein U9P49_03050, partial [Thermodesulfobacteriota bacterium]|nr:hypothetical protein [Thermodesulfobacteriota bacterium]
NYVYDTLRELKSVDKLAHLFCTCLNYAYSGRPVSTRGWKGQIVDSIRDLQLVATTGDFKIFWIGLRTPHLKRGEERAIVNKLNREFPYNLAVFSNDMDTQWNFVNVKLISDIDEENKDVIRRKIVRRIHIDETERIRTATEQISKLNIIDENISPLELQRIHDDAFDVEQVTEKFFSGIVRAGRVVEKGFIHIFDGLKKNLIQQAGDRQWAHEYTLQFLSRIMFLLYRRNAGLAMILNS